jgi:hypothetical protein
MANEQSHERVGAGARSVESAVLAIAIERHPESLSLCDLVAEMRTAADGPERPTQVESAVNGLIEVGLLAPSNDVLVVTPAALRAGELELGF